MESDLTGQTSVATSIWNSFYILNSSKGIELRGVGFEKLK